LSVNTAASRFETGPTKNSTDRLNEQGAEPTLPVKLAARRLSIRMAAY
jgi:hypothetical protein